jgi:hypothetical protein
MGKDSNTPKSTKSNRLGRKTSSSGQSQPKTDCILCFKDPKPNDKTIKAKFTESYGAKVSKQIRSWKTGDNKANPVALMNRIVIRGHVWNVGRRQNKKALPNHV